MATSASIITTGMARLSYVHLTAPRAANPNAEPKYSVTFLVPKPMLRPNIHMDAAVQTAIQEGIANPKSMERTTAG